MNAAHYVITKEGVNMKRYIVSLCLLGLFFAGCVSTPSKVCISGNCENGQGTLTQSDGSEYVGEFKDGEPNGQGTMTYANGDKYVGKWKDGNRTEQGKWIFDPKNLKDF
jgi:MORN repeat